MSVIIPGAEPFLVRGGPTGVLLLHGFTASPSEMRPLAAALAPEGHTLLSIRLPGHGTQPADLNRARWQDWQATAYDGFQLLRDQCTTIFVAGLSMGGALALLLATQEPVQAVISMSTPSLPFCEARGWAQRNAGWLGYLIPLLKKPAYGPPDHEHPVPRVAYPVRPVRALAQFYAVVREAALALPRVQAPALVIHSHTDGLIPPASADYLMRHLGSPDKEMFWLERGHHVLTEDPARPQVFAKIIEFLRRHT